MKKLYLILLLLLSFGFVQVHAVNITVITAEEAERLETEITRGEALSFFASYYKGTIPETYKYIELNFVDVKKTTPLYEDVQILVYLDLISNAKTQIRPTKTINLYTFNKLSERIIGITLLEPGNTLALKARNTTIQDLEDIKSLLEREQKQVEVGSEFGGVEQQVEVFQDVYKTLLDTHYDRNNLDKQAILYSAIEGLAEGADDTYTTYFPPTESKNFQDNINGEYEGIGSYVEMTDPGKLIIIAPIVGSPSEQAGVRGGDRVTHVDGKEITEDVSLGEAISWIKGPEGTSVMLTILRGTNTLELEVIRAKITIQDIEYSFLKHNTFYIQIKNFGPHVFDEFTEALDALDEQPQIKKIVIDVRNNPGGYLDQVSKILSYFVPKGEPTAIVDYGETAQVYKSKGYDRLDTSKYEIVLLQNSGSASASEILVGTLKDYYPDTTIIGEKSFGKGSVQNIKAYGDGSSLKFTVAKWFTGKNKTGIDGVGISPDIELEFDREKFEKGTDNQLEAAIKN